MDGITGEKNIFCINDREEFTKAFIASFVLKFFPFSKLFDQRETPSIRATPLYTDLAVHFYFSSEMPLGSCSVKPLNVKVPFEAKTAEKTDIFANDIIFLTCYLRATFLTLIKNLKSSEEYYS